MNRLPKIPQLSKHRMAEFKLKKLTEVIAEKHHIKNFEPGNTQLSVCLIHSMQILTCICAMCNPFLPMPTTVPMNNHE